MNTKKAAIIISGAIVAAGAGGFLYWDNAYNFTSGAKGRKINSDGYYADFEKFNGTDSSEKQRSAYRGRNDHKIRLYRHGFLNCVRNNRFSDRQGGI